MEQRSNDNNAASYLPPYLRPYSYPAFPSYSAVGYGGPAGYPLPYPMSSSSTIPPTNFISRPLPSVASMPTPSPTASPESPQDENGSCSPPAKKTPPPLPELPHVFRPINFNSAAADPPLTPDSGNPGSNSDNETNSAGSSASPSPVPQRFLISIPRLTSSKCSKDGLTLTLLDSELWKSFHAVGNEMIVTKPGRRLFPALLISLKGLEPSANYTISLRMVSADQYRYKFLSMHWVPVGESEVIQNEDRQIYEHPNSSNTGQFWMKKPISFKAIKITHNSTSKNGNILLHTMHKYSMEIVVRNDKTTLETTIEIPDTSFIAVTAYQNTKLTQLKIDNNPFAKGFRDRESAGGFVPGMPMPPFPSPYGPGTSLWQHFPSLPPVPSTGPPPLISSPSPLAEDAGTSQKPVDISAASYPMSSNIHPASFPHPYPPILS